MCVCGGSQRFKYPNLGRIVWPGIAFPEAEILKKKRLEINLRM